MGSLYLYLKSVFLICWASQFFAKSRYSLDTGVVTQVKNYGVFLRLPHIGKPVLCPTRMLQDYYVEDPESLVEVGQTLWTKVVDVDPDARYFSKNNQAKR